MCKDIDAFNVWFHSVFGENAETFCGFSLNYDYRDLERVIYNKIKNEKTQLRRTKIQGLVVLVNKGYYARSGVLYATEQWHSYVNSILANHSRPFGIVIYDEFGGVCEEKLVSIGDNGLYVSKLLNETPIRLYEQALIVFNKGALDQSNEDFRDKVTAAFTKT